MDVGQFSGYLSAKGVEIHSAYRCGVDDSLSLWAMVDLKYGSELTVPIIFSSKDAEILKSLAGEESEDVFKGSTSFAFIEVAANNGLKIEYAVITDMEKDGSNRGKLHGGLVVGGEFYGMDITDAVIIALGTGKEIRIGENTLADVAGFYEETVSSVPTEAPSVMYV